MPCHWEEGAGRAELAVGQKSVKRKNLYWFDQFYGGLTNYAMRVVTATATPTPAAPDSQLAIGPLWDLPMVKSYWKLSLINIAN
jgi:hypothetical protein